MSRHCSRTRNSSDGGGSRRSWLKAVGTGTLLALAPLPALALTLAEAKARGWVGERIDGYLGIVTPDAPAAVRKLVEEVNAKRRKAYEEIARKNGVPVEAVAVIAGRKAIEKTPSGQYVMGEDGRWHRKP